LVLNTISYDLTAISETAKHLINASEGQKIWIFQGQMGAGKTTLIKALAHEMGIVDQISSPTFGIVNEYDLPDKKKIYHFDFYRLNDPLEALDIGIEEYFYSGNYCWIEWAEKIVNYLPEDFFLIKIEIGSDTTRNLTLHHTQETD
jgi:tRNA threonylcarbamoyladenosine biosynthesis protein TsaE